MKTKKKFKKFKPSHNSIERLQTMTDAQKQRAAHNSIDEHGL